MAIDKLLKRPRLVAGVAALSVMLAACGKSPSPANSEAPPPASEAPASEPPATAPAPATETPPADAAEPTPSPAPTTPPPTEPSPTPAPTAAAPALESMQRAVPSAKISVPVDLRYQFDSSPVANQPVTLHLAAVPRVAGSGLRVSVKQADGVTLKGSALQVQKASATGVYRQQFAVTRSATGADHLRVLVTMEMPEGKAFGYFSIPLEAAAENSSQKLESVKQR